MLERMFATSVGTIRYLLFGLLMMFHPVVRIVCGFLIAASALAFIFYLIAAPDRHLPLFLMLGVGLASVAFQMFYNILLSWLAPPAAPMMFMVD